MLPEENLTRRKGSGFGGGLVNLEFIAKVVPADEGGSLGCGLLM